MGLNGEGAGSSYIFEITNGGKDKETLYDTTLS